MHARTMTPNQAKNIYLRIEAPTAPPTAPAPAPTTAPGGPATRKPPAPPRPAPAKAAQPPTASEAMRANTNLLIRLSPEEESIRSNF